MPFSNASGIVTITGTETDASAFADPFNAASGDVGTYIDRIPGIPGSSRYLYVYKSVRLVIQGTFSIQNSCVFNFNPVNDWGPIRVDGGTLNIGGEQTLYSLAYGSQYPLYLGFKRDTLGSSGAFQDAWRWGAVLVNIYNSGTVNIYGADIHFKEGNIFSSRSDDGGSQGLFEPGTLLIKNSRIAYHSDNSSSVGRMSFGGNFNFTADDVQLVGSNGLGLFELSDSGLSLSISRMAFRHLDKPLQINNSVTGRTFEGFDFRGNNAGVLYNQNGPKTNTFRNNLEGNNMNVGWGTNRAGTALLSCSVELAATAGGSPVNPKFKVADTNSGNRQSDYSSDFQVSGELAGGTFSINDLFTGVYDKPINTDPDPTLDSRLPYTGIARLYGSLDFAINITDSNPQQSVPITMISDPVIALSETAAGALTGILIDHAAQLVTLSENHTLSEVYDYHAWDLAQDANIITTLRAAWFISSDGMNFTSNYDVTLSGSISLSGGQFILEAGRKLTLGTNASYTNLTLPATAVVNVDSSPSELDLSSSTNVISFGTVFEITDGGSITITVVDQSLANQLNLDKLETNGSINFIFPIKTTIISGFPTSNSSYQAGSSNTLDPTPVLGIYDASIGATPAGYLADFQPTDAEYNNGAYTIIPSNYTSLLNSGTEILVVGDAVGWKRTSGLTIDTMNPPAALDIAPSFIEFLDEAGYAFIGESQATVGLTYNQGANRFELASMSGGVSDHYDFAGIAYRQELLTSNSLGLQIFDTALVRLISYIRNDSYKRIFIPAALSVAAAEDAETSPIISDFILLKTDNTDPFDHGLSSSASGLTDRPEVLIRFQSNNIDFPSENLIATTILTQSLSELSSIPSASAQVQDILKLLYMLARNKIVQNETTTTLFADDGTTTVGSAAINETTNPNILTREKLQ